MNEGIVRASLYLSLFSGTDGYLAITKGKPRILESGEVLLPAVFVKSGLLYTGGVLSHGRNFNDKEIIGVIVSEDPVSPQEAAFSLY